MDDTIVLMGAPRSGKTTVGKLLAEHLDRPFHMIPDMPLEIFREAGFDEAAARQAWEADGFEGWYRVIKPFQPVALRSELQKHAGAVVELGALLQVQEDPVLQAEVAAILAPHRTILLQPSSDADEAVRVLDERQRILFQGLDLNEYFVRHPSNARLAKQQVYTKDKTPTETRDEVLARIDPTQPEVILIGPMGTGKSTIGRMLAEQLGRPQAPLDQHRWRYYEEIGFSKDEMDRIHHEQGPTGVLQYWKRFEVHAVQRILEEYPGAVIDFGAGHSVYDDEADARRVQELLAPYHNVVLLLPSPDPDESIRLLHERNTPRIDGVELNRYLLSHPANRELAKYVVYTDGKTPSQTRDEILEWLKTEG